MKAYLQFVTIALCMSAMSVDSSNAQITSLFKEKSESLQLREREAFINPDITTIPYEGYTLKDYAERNFPELGKKCLEMYPIETNRVLAEKVYQNQKNQVDGNTLEVKKEFTDIAWGTFTTFEDGKTYLVTQENEKSVRHNPSSEMWYYRSATFTIYDDNLEKIKSFKVASSDTTYSFTLMPDVSYKVFNNDSDWEFMVQIHGFENTSIGGPEACRDTVVIINENNKILKKIYQASDAYINTVRGKYSNTYHLQVSRPYYSSELQDEQTILFYDPKKINVGTDETPDPLFVYSVSGDLLSYVRGPIFYYLDIDGTDYYMATKYEKPFCKVNDPVDPVWETDNKYIVTLYNTSFEKVKEFSLPLIGQEDNNLSMSKLLDFSDYMISSHIFNSDDNLELVYGMERYYAECDCMKTDYYLVNEKGEIIQELFQKTVGVIGLPKLVGQPDEYAVLFGPSSDEISSIMMYRMPDLQETFTFPSLYQGNLLSLSFSRLLKDNSYQYVFGLGRGEQGENTVLGGVNYYDTAGKLQHKVRFDLGNKIWAFSPILNPTTLNPYGFVADDKREYLFFAMDYLGNDKFQQRFSIANEEEILYTWNFPVGEIIKGAGVLGNAQNTELRHFYINSASAIGTSTKTQFYNLPLVQSVLEGEGTELNPYQIRTASDLNSIREHPEAWYVLQNDIDMIEYTGLSGIGFNPIASFTGHFDGKNHVIKNLLLSTVDQSTGLFKEISQGGIVKNLQLQKVSWSYLSDNVTMGTLAAVVSYNSTVDNCHVITDIDTDISARYLGGLVGSVTKSSVLKNSSFDGNIRASLTNSVGGIAGNNNQGEIVSCYSEGNLLGKNDVGGIVGLIASGIVKNCYSTMDVSASVRLGGIVGNVSGTVENTYACGDIVSLGGESDRNAGGIAGGAQASVVASPLVKNNIAMNEKIIVPIDSARILNTKISGALIGNYALKSMLLGSDLDNLHLIDDSDTEHVGLDKIHGQSVEAEQLDQAFYEAMGWSFGTDTDNPWVMYENSPRLWFEFVVRGVQVEETRISMLKGEKQMLKASVIPENATNQNLRYTSSDLKVASVSSNGEITARGEGMAEITVTTEEGGYKAVCQVSVIIPVSEITLSAEEITLEVNEKSSLTATVMPEDATNTAYYWTSSNSDVVYVYDGVVVGMSAGTADVIVCSEDGYASDTCHVTVVTPISEIYLNESTVSLDKATPTFQLVAKASPETAVLPALYWSSDNKKVAQVDQTGLVSGYQKGEAIVTVETEDGRFSASCLVEVLEEIGVGLDMTVSDQIRVYVEQDELNVEADREISSVCMLNSAGQTMYLNQAVNNKRFTLPVSEMNEGIVMVRVLCDGHWFVHKVVLR